MGTKGSFTASLIIIAIIVCALGILILPQVDLPDFVLNGSKCPSVAKVHVRAASASFRFAKMNGLRSVLISSEPHRSGSSSLVSDPFSVLNTLFALRC